MHKREIFIFRGYCNKILVDLYSAWAIEVILTSMRTPFNIPIRVKI